MNERSILICSTGISRSLLSDEKPSPKSSIATPTPSACSRSSGPRAAVSSMAADSVTSTTTRDGSMPCRSRAARSRSTYSGLRSSRGAAFTLRRGVRPRSCHSAACRQSSSITQVADRLDQPAVLGRGDEGGRRHQAARGVVPAQERLHGRGLPAVERVDRLVVQLQLVALDRPAQPSGQGQPVERVLLLGRVDHVARRGPRAWPGTWRCRPGAAAPRRRRPAAGRGSRRGWRSRGTRRPPPPPARPAPRPRARRWPRRSPFRRRAGPGSSRKNSSPPVRASRSPCRLSFSSRRAMDTSSSSPTGWPRLSFTSLKSSRSRQRRPTERPDRRARSIAAFTLSESCARLGSPVSGSW